MASSEAGPSRSRFTAKSELAPIHIIPTVSLLALEYPGYIAPSDPSSVQRALSTLGGQPKIDQVLSSADPSTLELNFGRTGEDQHATSRWRHGILPTAVSGDKIVLRIKKRTKVRVEIGPDGEKRKVRLDHGEFTTEVVGPVSKIVRYRAISDFQYRPPDEGLSTKVASALANQDYDTISHLDWPERNGPYATRVSTDDNAAMDVDPAENEEDDDTTSKLVSVTGMFAPPRFTMQSVPLKYHFKAATTMQVLTTNAIDEDRYVYKNKNKGTHLLVHALDSTDPVPSESPDKAAMAKVDQKLLAKVRQLFQDPGTVPGLETRPVWTRHALGNMFKEPEGTISSLLKPILAHVSWTFYDGAFRDTLIRFGFDPRKDREARIWQPTHLRIIGKRDTGTKTLAHKTRAPKAPDILPGGDARRTHVFDGTKLHKEFSGFQLCDITEPQLAAWIADDVNTVESFQIENGWYRPTRLRLIKRLLRAKYVCLLEHGVPLPRQDCDAVIEASLAEERVLEGGGQVEIEEEMKAKEPAPVKEKKPVGRPKGSGRPKTAAEMAAAKSRGRLGGKIRGAAEEEKIAARLRRDLGISNSVP